MITEKPSVARDLARVLGVGSGGRGFLEGRELVLTWCVGHLVELEEPAHYDSRWKRWSLETLPMLPERFELRPRKGAGDQWTIVRRLMRDRRFERVINACDAGREGELIFRYAYELAECGLPIDRLWLSSLTTEAIRDGWAAIRPGVEFEALGDAARCRSEADWLVGLNATRAMTCLARKGGGDGLLSIGRVQTPTLAMIVSRDREIESFVPEPFWYVDAEMSHARSGVAWKARFFRGDVAEERPGPQGGDAEVSHAERLPTEELAKRIAEASRGREGNVEQSSRKRVTESPPLLYDLTALQRRANQRYGFDAGKTLEIAQALYERHKLITYPRTDARHLTPDQVGELPGILEGLGRLDVYTPFVGPLLEGPLSPGKRVVDASEVGDHHAIIPTGRTPRSSGLAGDEKRVFDLVARRFIAALSPAAVFEKTVLVVAVEAERAQVPDEIDVPLRFRARGRVCLEEGWRAVDPPKKRREELLPRIAQGDVARVETVDVTEGATRAPRPYTDASLLGAMERAGSGLDDAELKRAMRSAGLGTPATRAAILQTLLNRRYIVRDKRDLRATPNGMALIDSVPVDELKSAELTGRYEARLARIAEGKDSRGSFMHDVWDHVREVVRAIAESDPPVLQSKPAEDAGPALGECPVCGTPVRERRAVYACDTGRSCAFVVFKKIARRPISRRMVKTLLAEGRTQAFKGFRSRAGKAFTAGLVVEDGGKVGLWFPERGGERSQPSDRVAESPAPPAQRVESPASPASPVGRPCPRCGRGRLVAGRAAWGCGRWRDGCDFVLSFEVGGVRRTDAEAVAALTASD